MEVKGKLGERLGETKGNPSVSTTKVPGEAAWIRIVTREFTISATIFWAATEATINYWGWSADISPAIGWISTSR